jgi:RNA polymerase sigma-70 factor (ECF subfamily)
MGIIERNLVEPHPDPIASSPDELHLVAALRRGEEAAFAMLIEQYHTSLLRLAMMYVSSRTVAEEVVQDTWLGVLQGLARFQGRSSLKTWIFRILTNRAKTRGVREGRSIPFSAIWNAEADPCEPAVAADRFFPPEHEDAGWWSSHPQNWDDLPEDRLLAQELRARIHQAIEALPPSQREVITLRDVEGWAAGEVCHALGISETNQRVLLHRARSKVRGTVEMYLSEG